MALFSLSITVGGVSLAYFTDVTVKRSQDGFGFGGLVTTQLSFSTTKSAWEAVGTYAMAKVIVSGVSGLPSSFFIDNRTASDGKVTVTALDRMAFTDTAFPYDSLGGTSEKVQLSSVLQLICSTCGFDGYSFNDINGIYQSYYLRSKCEGISCSEILTDIAKNEIGSWCVIDNELVLYYFRNGAGSVSVEKHTAVNAGLDYTIAGVRYTDNEGNSYDVGNTAYSYNTIQVESEYATAQAAAAAYGRCNGTYPVISVSKAFIDNSVVPAVPYYVAFKQTEERYYIHSVTAKIGAFGVICEFSTNNPLTSEIGMRGKLTRAVAGKVSLNSKMGCQKITPYQGTVYVDEETEES